MACDLLQLKSVVPILVIRRKYLSAILEKLEKNTTTEMFVDSGCYQKAEQQAKWYLQELTQLREKGTLFTNLTKDYRQWQSSNSGLLTNKFNLSELEAEQTIADSTSSLPFLKRLAAEHKLKEYLTKSITYIFIRDMGASLKTPNIQRKIKSSVNKIYRLINKNIINKEKGVEQEELFSAEKLLKLARKHKVESTLFWLMGKLTEVQQQMPEEIDQTNGMRKLVKIIAGVTLHHFMNLTDNDENSNQKNTLDNAIRLGYCYGLTYPFIDDLQDSANALSPYEKAIFNEAIRASLIAGKVVDMPVFSQQNQSKMSFIYQELSQAFDYIRTHQDEKSAQIFFEQAYVFFEAQDIDRQRKLNQQSYTTEELFLPIILKSAGCRLIARSLLDIKSNDEFNYHTFCFGIYNQFNDDIKDIFEDLDEGNVTPYTYYLSKQSSSAQNQLSNPYSIYWAVVHYLTDTVYANDTESKKLILERSINAHKSLRNSVGIKTYTQLRQTILNSGNIEFDQLINTLVESPNDIAWFDKLVSREVSNHFDKQKVIQQTFKQRTQTIKSFVEQCLPIKPQLKQADNTLLDAANYSLQAGGKRLRSILAYIISVDKYKLEPAQIKPLLQLLEYMHTASIIFDDKPSQDDADLRRGQATLHKKYNSEATAELSAVFMMMRAVEVQTQLHTFKAEHVLQSLAYSSSTTQSICQGQLMDLKSTNLAIDVTQLEKISYLKTGLAIEAALLLPAILVGEHDIEKEHLKQFSKHLGLAFQIKDDLLDHQGDSQKLGKPVKQDNALNKATFVSCLGVEAAQQKLFEHYYSAHESLNYLGDAKRDMKQILDFVVYRNQ